MEGAGGIRTDGPLFGGKSLEKTFPGWIVRMNDAIPSQDLPGGHQQNLVASYDVKQFGQFAQSRVAQETSETGESLCVG